MTYIAAFRHFCCHSCLPHTLVTTCDFGYKTVFHFGCMLLGSMQVRRAVLALGLSMYSSISLLYQSDLFFSLSPFKEDRVFCFNIFCLFLDFSSDGCLTSSVPDCRWRLQRNTDLGSLWPLSETSLCRRLVACCYLGHVLKLAPSREIIIV